MLWLGICPSRGLATHTSSGYRVFRGKYTEEVRANRPEPPKNYGKCRSTGDVGRKAVPTTLEPSNTDGDRDRTESCACATEDPRSAGEQITKLFGGSAANYFSRQIVTRSPGFSPCGQARVALKAQCSADLWCKRTLRRCGITRTSPPYQIC